MSASAILGVVLAFALPFHGTHGPQPSVALSLSVPLIVGAR